MTIIINIGLSFINFINYFSLLLHFVTATFTCYFNYYYTIVIYSYYNVIYFNLPYLCAAYDNNFTIIVGINFNSFLAFIIIADNFLNFNIPFIINVIVDLNNSFNCMNANQVNFNYTINFENFKMDPITTFINQNNSLNFNSLLCFNFNNLFNFVVDFENSYFNVYIMDWNTSFNFIIKTIVVLIN